MKRLIVVSAVLLTLVGAAYCSYSYYQNHHLSADLRQILIAEVNPHSSGSEGRSYLREARLRVRTKRDVVVEQEAEDAFDLYVKAADATNDYDEQVARVKEAQQETSRLLKDPDIPFSVKKSSYKETRALFMEWAARQDVLSKQSDAANKKGLDALNKVRGDLGIPPWTPPEK